MTKWIIVLVLLSSSVWAGPLYPPPMCADGEDIVVCDLKIQRNNALDELVISDNARKHETQYWATYVEGMENQRNQVSAWWALYVRGLELDRKESSDEHP